jgi:hypothetical protein
MRAPGTFERATEPTRRTDATRDRHSVGGDAEAALRVPAGVDYGDALAARGAHRAR